MTYRTWATGSQMSQFAARMSEHLGRSSGDWWMAHLLAHTRTDANSPLSHAAFGCIVAVDTALPHRMRIAAQPSLCCPPEHLANLLSLAGPDGRAAASALNSLAPGRGPFRGEWQIAVGSTVGRGHEDIDVSVWAPGRSRSAYLLQGLRAAGVWGPLLANDAVEIIERVRLFGVLTRFSKRYGRQIHYQLGFEGVKPLSTDLIAYIAEPLGMAGVNQLQTFAERDHRRPSVVPGDYHWIVTLDADGKLVAVELELRYHPAVSQAPVPSDATSKQWLAWITRAGRDCGLKAGAWAVSCRLQDEVPSFVHSVDFARDHQDRSNGEARVFTASRCPSCCSPEWSEWGNTPFAAGHRALEAVLAAQDDQGAWHDFYFQEKGASDTWVTAYVGLRLSMLPPTWLTANTETGLAAAADYLVASWRPGWGYNTKTPPDADSIAYAMLFLQAMGRAVPDDAVSTLLKFQQADGGFATYLASEDLSVTLSWCLSHCDVTPVAVRALLPYTADARVATAVARGHERMALDGIDDGTWPAFWWYSHWYTTAAWLQTLRRMGLPSTRLAEAMALAISVEYTSDVDAAWHLECLIVLGNMNEAREVAKRLARRQCQSGLWPVAPIQRLTHPNVIWPWEMADSGPLFADVQGIYSAATILSVLAQVCSAEEWVI